MDEARVESLREQRTILVDRVQAMLETPESQRPTERTALKSWLAELEGTQRMLEQLDRLLKMLEPKPKKAARPPAPPSTGADQQSGDESVMVARIPKGKCAEIRVTLSTWRGRRIIDVRVWAVRKDTGEWGPSRKGVAVAASALPALMEALQAAQKHA